MSEEKAEKTMDSNSKKIIELFKDDSFPSMVLIDGKWGSGKTHYVENILIDDLKNEYQTSDPRYCSPHYLSLYGVSSIDDFRDRIVSICLSGSGDPSQLAKSVNTLTESFSKLNGNSGVGGLLSGVTGVYKYSVYSQLSNKIFILDDLERVNKDIIKNILGECFNLVTKKNNVKVLVLASTDKINAEADLEKVFQDKITIEYTPKQIVDFALKGYPDLLSPELTNQLVQVIKFNKEQTLTNIRVLKRALVRFKEIKTKLRSIPEIDHEIAESNLLRQIVTICFARYELDYSVRQITTSNYTFYDDNINEKSTTDKILGTLFQHTQPHSKLIDFCCNNQYSFENIVEELNLPVNCTLADKVLHYLLRFNMTEDEFNNGIKEIEEYLKLENNIDFLKYFSFCDCLITLIDNKYCEVELTKTQILDFAENLSFESCLPTSIHSRYRGFGHESKDLEQIYRDKEKEFLENLDGNKQTDFVNSFKKSLNNVIDEIYKKYEYKAFLHTFKAEELKDIIINWEPSDIYQFNVFLNGQYSSFLNIEDSYEPQHEVLVNTTKLLIQDVKRFVPSLKLGALNELIPTLNDINNKMEERLSLKNNRPN